MASSDTTAGFQVLRFDLLPPSRGWATLRCSKGPSVWQVVFSAIPEDTIADLVEATDSAVTIPGTRVVVLREEPQETELVLRHWGQPSRITMTLIRYSDRRREAGEELLEVTLSPLLAGRLIWRGLRSLGASLQPGDYEREWGYPFPSRLVDQLGARLDGQVAR